ncbi:MAG: twin-arginine translocation signal domain-containing protein [Planctomycetota bacterium]
MKSISRRSFVKGMAAIPAAAALSGPFCGKAHGQGERPRGFSEAGWCWDGQGFNGGVNPSIFGAGEGTKWFGLKKTAYMFHPNTELALEKLRDFEEVLCEISKWKVRRCENGVAHYLDGKISTKCEEALAVSRLSRRFPNITGAIDDDLQGIIRRERITPEQYASVYEALKSENPGLKLWTVVYDRELDREKWAGFEPLMDVVNLCVGNQTTDFPNLSRYLDQCGELFPGKPINLIYRLRDFGYKPVGPVRLDLLEQHWKDIRGYVEQGRLSGYSILGGFLIDMHTEQARWLRDFIAAD